MNVEQRIRQLLRAACRVEREGDLHVAGAQENGCGIPSG